MVEIDAIKRSALAGFGGGLLIGVVGLLFVRGNVDFGYWIISFLIAIHLDVLYSFLFQLDINPPFSPVLLADAEEDKKWRLSAALFAVLVIIPFLSYMGFITYF